MKIRVKGNPDAPIKEVPEDHGRILLRGSTYEEVFDTVPKDVVKEAAIQIPLEGQNDTLPEEDRKPTILKKKASKKKAKKK